MNQVVTHQHSHSFEAMCAQSYYAPILNRLSINCKTPLLLPLSLSRTFSVPDQHIACKLHLSVMLRQFLVRVNQSCSLRPVSEVRTSQWVIH